MSVFSCGSLSGRWQHLSKLCSAGRAVSQPLWSRRDKIFQQLPVTTGNTSSWLQTLEIPAHWEVNSLEEVDFLFKSPVCVCVCGQCVRIQYSMCLLCNYTMEKTNTIIHFGGVTLPFNMIPLSWERTEFSMWNVSLMIKYGVKMEPCDKTRFPISWSWMEEPCSSSLTKPACEAQIVSLFIIKMCSAHIKPTSYTLWCHISSTFMRLMFC